MLKYTLDFFYSKLNNVTGSDFELVEKKMRKMNFLVIR